MREFAQAGVELIGAEAPEGTAEVVEVLSAALDAAGLARAVIGLGDADLYRQLLDELGVADERRDRILEVLATHDLVGPRGGGRRARDRRRRRETLLRLPGLRGDREVLDQAHELGGEAVERATERLAATYEALAARGVAERVNSTSACCATSATTRARSSRSTTPRSGTCSAAAAATTS